MSSLDRLQLIKFKIIVGKLIGHGQFGKVYEGFAYLDEAGVEASQVAIKVPRGTVHISGNIVSLISLTMLQLLVLTLALLTDFFRLINKT